MRRRTGPMLSAAFTIIVAAALTAIPDTADAKGGRRSSSSSSKSTPAATKADKDKDKSDSGGIHITIRPGSSSSSGSGGSSAGFAPGGKGSMQLQPIAPHDPEEAERQAQKMAAYEKAMAEKAAEQKAAAERAEASRAAAEKAAADKAAREAAEQKAEAARQAAAAEKKRREQAALAAEVDAVLERAKSDHPVLRTPEGEPILRSILERQQALQKRGVYPSIAMVEAVADHQEQLRPRRRAEPAADATARAPADHSKTYGNCRWITPYQWGCN